MIDESEEESEVIQNQMINRSIQINRDVKHLNRRFNFLVKLQVIMIVILLFNTVMTYYISIQKDAVINAGRGIEIKKIIESERSSIYEVQVILDNTGFTLANVHISGEIYILNGDSGSGEEIVDALGYRYYDIEAGKKLYVDLGSFTAYHNSQYVIRVYVGWNGGSIKLSEIFTPES